MVKTLAEINLFKGEEKRKTPFISDYRPLFSFIPEAMAIGQILLLDRDEFRPGETGIVEIRFPFSDYLGEDFGIGKKFNFRESKEVFGEGEIIEILDNNTLD